MKDMLKQNRPHWWIICWCTIVTTLALTGIFAFLKISSVETVSKQQLPTNPVPTKTLDLFSEDSKSNTSTVPTIWYENEVVVWTYHHVDEHKKTNATITPALFREHMEWIRSQNYHPISAQHYIQFLEGSSTVPPNAILITFDDGYSSFYEQAFPILREYGYPSLHFVIVGQIRHPDDVQDATKYIPKLNWRQLKELHSTGLVTFGSHTFDLHRYLGVDEHGEKQIPEMVAPTFREEADQMESELDYEKRVWMDLTFSRIQLEKWLGEEIPILAFPYGAYSEKSLRIAKEVGFPYLFGFRSGVTSPNEWDGEPVYRYHMGQPDLDLDSLEVLLNEIHEKLNAQSP
jgi:biofilm PGA synthesis lipoprotein PgaB